MRAQADLEPRAEVEREAVRREAGGGNGLPEGLVGSADGGAATQPEAERVGSALEVARCSRVRPTLE